MSKTTDRVGQVINQRYELLDVVGRGGQGLVYRAYDRWTQRAVALKVLTAQAAREPQMEQRLIREQQALSALRGTAAVELVDVCRSNTGELCLVMELLSGTDLEHYLYDLEERGERMDLLRVAEIFDPIVKTLETAHAAGILHRDLKPANVFLLDTGGVRLLDFGLARLSHAAPLTAIGTLMGSPSFMAPEAWRGRSELVDHRADVYSLGVILFRVLAGDLPFAGESLAEKFLGSTTGARPSLIALRPDLPRIADEWVALALAINPDERFGNVRALWNAFLSTFELEAHRGGHRATFWSAAKTAMRKLGTSALRSQPPPALPRDPSASPQVLRTNIIDVGPPPLPRRAPIRPEATIELSDLDIIEAAAPLMQPIRGEQTIVVSDLDLILSEEPTLDLVLSAELAPEPEPTPPAPEAAPAIATAATPACLAMMRRRRRKRSRRSRAMPRARRRQR